jgi:6,7-dimethyl-8-ribityllumazine synthase
MQQAKQGDFQPFTAKDWKLGIVVAEFNKHITSQLLNSALARAKEYGIAESSITIKKVAGAVEIPLVLQSMAKSGDYDVLLAIGCVIRGATPHFEYVCKFATEGVLRVQLDNDMPIGFGVLSCDDEQQAQERAHLGGEHLDAVMHQAKVMR